MTRKLVQININGFRSIRSAHVDFRPLLALVGSNGAGKSNLVDAIAFLADVYRIGLDASLSDIGGLDATLYRSKDAQQHSLSLSAKVNIAASEQVIEVEHGFTINSLHDRIGRFEVSKESLKVSIAQPTIDSVRKSPVPSVHFKREQNKLSATRFANSEPGVVWQEIGLLATLINGMGPFSVDNSSLFFPAFAPLSSILKTFFDTISGSRVFEIVPEDARQDADRSHNPELSRFGVDLPAALEWLNEDHPQVFMRIVAGLRETMPALRNILIVEGHADVRAIEFAMEDGPSPLRASEISDGSIRYLGLLMVLHDPRSSIIMLEEPENSLHPWMISRLAEQIVEASSNKQIILTTHSPLLMSKLPIDAISVVHMTRSGTKISPIKELQPLLYELWANGDITVFDSVESGAIPEMIPSLPE